MCKEIDKESADNPETAQCWAERYGGIIKANKILLQIILETRKCQNKPALFRTPVLDFGILILYKIRLIENNGSKGCFRFGLVGFFLKFAIASFEWTLCPWKISGNYRIQSKVKEIFLHASIFPASLSVLWCPAISQHQRLPMYCFCLFLSSLR